MQTETVQVSDPRRLPTVRLPRKRVTVSVARTPASSGRPSLPDDNAPTLRSASPMLAPAPRRSPWRRWWIGGVVAAAITGIVLVAVAARLRSSAPPDAPAPSAAPRPRSSSPPSAPPSSEPASPSSHRAPPRPRPPHRATPAAPPRPPLPAPPRRTRRPHPAPPKSDRWF
ncbi:MAG: hypothetical protein R3F14_14040 [Polyangiaceae bacterium]